MTDKSKTKKSDRPSQGYVLNDFEFASIKRALQSSIGRFRDNSKNEDERPSVRAMLACEADEMQEALDSIRTQHDSGKAG